MTKRTEKLVLSVFEYFVKAALKSQKEGILVLEELRLDKGLSETGEILFNRKVDKFINWMLGLVLGGVYSQEANQDLLKSLSRFSSKRTKIGLNVASVCLDCIANGTDLNKLVVQICVYVGVENQPKLSELIRDLKAQTAKDFEYKLTEEQKKRIVETNVFFKMKEDECNTILKQKNENLCELHLRVPEFKTQYACVRLVFKPKGRIFDEAMYSCGIPESNNYQFQRSKEIYFIGDIPVCYSMYGFWNSHNNCGRDIKKFMALTDDIPNNVEKYLLIQSSISLESEE